MTGAAPCGVTTAFPCGGACGSCFGDRRISFGNGQLPGLGVLSVPSMGEEAMKSIVHKMTRGLFGVAAVLLAATMIAGPALARDCKRTPGGLIHPPMNVKFDLNSIEISPEDQERLNKIAERFAGNSHMEVCLIGVTDRTGDAAYNKKLAMQRAEAVADFLRSAGLKDNTYQIVARGQAYSDESWLGKLLGSKPVKGERRVDVLLME